MTAPVTRIDAIRYARHEKPGKPASLPRRVLRKLRG